MKVTLIIVLCSFVLFIQTIKAQDQVSDSAFSSYTRYTKMVDSIMPKCNPVLRRFDYTWGKLTSRPLFQAASVAVPLIVVGFIIKKEDQKFNDLRNSYLPQFRHNVDDYLQYSPAALMVGLKIAGIKGRSNWPRMLTTDAIAAALMAGSVNLLKHTTSVERPDGTDNHSFPSGHTATAFMCATMLHREYGLTVSPWYSIGGYTIATATGVLRQINNKHWFSDVLVGAGIGILSTEVAYWITDKIFKDKGITRPELNFRNYNFLETHSSIGIQACLDRFPFTYTLNDGNSLKMRSGSSMGATGQWGITPHWGIVGRVSFTNALVYYNDTPIYSHEVIESPSRGRSTSLRMQAFEVGAQYAHPLSLRWQIAGKITTGYTYYNKIYNDLSLRLGNRGGVNIGCGGNLGFYIKQNLVLNGLIDYRFDPPLEHGSSHKISHLIIGSSANIVF